MKQSKFCHFADALRAMEKVASHINEMQKIYEDYGTVFDQLVAEQCSTKKEVCTSEKAARKKKRIKLNFKVGHMHSRRSI